jgi:salicylate hydroxylase
VQLQSRWIGDHVYHPAGAHARLRDALLAAKTPDEFYDSLDWLYGGSGLGDDPAAAAGAVGSARAGAAARQAEA